MAAIKNKIEIQRVPVALLVACEQALAEGRIKYGEQSWRTKGEKVSNLIGGLIRHAAAYWDGEDVDPESSTGKTHLAGMVANLAILLDAQACGTLTDDRPTGQGPAGKLLRSPGFKDPSDEAEEAPARQLELALDVPLRRGIL